MGRPPKITPKKVRAFLHALTQCPNVAAAARGSGISRHAWYVARDADVNFAGQWEAAVEEGVDKLEEEMWRRAVEGNDRPVYQGGEKVGDIREYSDTLAIFLAKGHRPDKFADRKHVKSEMKIEVKPEELSDEELAKIVKEGE